MRAIISDIHANLPALEAVLEHIDEVGVTRIVSLGDVVGYGASPSECIQLLRERDIPNILGNHDNYLAFNMNCERSRTVAEIIDYQRSLLSESDIAWLRASPRSIREGDQLFVHGSPMDYTDGYIYEVSSDIFQENVKKLFVGHTHVQASFDFEEKLFCNPGSVGQPRDGNPKAAYAILDGEKLSLHRVEYDIDSTVASMVSAGFASYCYENLFKGSQIGGRIDRILRY